MTRDNRQPEGWIFDSSDPDAGMDFTGFASFDGDDLPFGLRDASDQGLIGEAPRVYVRRRRTASDEDDDDELRPPGRLRQAMVVVVTLLLIFAILATSLLPGLLAAERNHYLRELPPPTVQPRI